MLLQQQSLELFADYHQFYLWDEGMSPRAPEDYCEEDVERRIKIGPYVVVIQPQRNMTVTVELEIHDDDPRFESGAWDHIAEASLHLPTGKLEVHECTGGSVAKFSVAPGWYRVRMLGSGYETIDETGLEGDDSYLLQLWPSPEAALNIVKQWEGEWPD